MNVFVEKHIETRWQQEAASCEKALVFSPFVTGPLADQVFTAREGVQFELYTTFSARTFASRGSCLDTLERLLGHVSVFEIPRLHAKIMLIPGKLVTFGSQNLTQGGKTNLEGSVLTDDPNLVATVESEVEPWVKRSTPITLARIAEMRKRVNQLRELWSQFDSASKRSDEEERKHRLIRNIRNSKTPNSEVVEGEVKKSPGLPNSYRLIFRANKTFRNLRVRDLPLPKRTNRYLCMNEDTGMLGWARVAETEITLVSKRIPHDYDVDIEEETSPTNISAVWDEDSLRTHNLVIGLQLKRGKCAVHCLFDTVTLTAVECKWSPDASHQSEFDIVGYINGNEKGIADDLISLITGLPENPENEKLSGAYANEFFGDAGTRCVIKLARVGNHPVLIVKVNEDSAPHS